VLFVFLDSGTNLLLPILTYIGYKQQEAMRRAQLSSIATQSKYLRQFALNTISIRHENFFPSRKIYFTPASMHVWGDSASKNKKSIHFNILKEYKF
jgi:hypothetical protein